MIGIGSERNVRIVARRSALTTGQTNTHRWEKRRFVSNGRWIASIAIAVVMLQPNTLSLAWTSKSWNGFDPGRPAAINPSHGLRTNQNAAKSPASEPMKH